MILYNCDQKQLLDNAREQMRELLVEGTSIIISKEVGIEGLYLDNESGNHQQFFEPGEILLVVKSETANMRACLLDCRGQNFYLSSDILDYTFEQDIESTTSNDYSYITWFEQA